MPNKSFSQIKKKKVIAIVTSIDHNRENFTLAEKKREEKAGAPSQRSDHPAQQFHGKYDQKFTFI